MAVKIYQRKAFVISAVALLLVAGVMAAVQYATTQVDVTVNEALSTTTTNVAVSGFPGEILNQSLDITNAASVPLNTTLTFTEDVNPDGVSYTTNMPMQVTLQPGANIVDIEFTIATDSAVGVFNGSITLERTA